MVQRKPSAVGPAPATGALEGVHSTGAGRRLSAGQRRRIEPVLGHSLAHARVHDSPRDRALADSLGARAFTTGSQIVLGSGERADDLHLIAHEATHVVQQSRGAPAIQRQPACLVDPPGFTPVHRESFDDAGGGGTTEYVETMWNKPAKIDGVHHGHVQREIYAPASDTQPCQQIHDAHVGVEYHDAPGGPCKVRVPFEFAFVERQTASDPEICDEPPADVPVPPIAAPRLDSLGRDYVAAVNAGLNGAFALRISGCQANCAGTDIPIEVAATRGSNNPDATISVVNRDGRGDAATMCVANGLDRWFAVHEGGHQALGAGDEYRERSRRLRRQNPTWARDERVRSDSSQMGTHGRLRVFHERHFRFAQVYVQSILPDCTVELVRVREPAIDFRLDVDMGYVRSFSGTNLFGIGVGAGLGIPLTPDRVWLLEMMARTRGMLLWDGSTATLDDENMEALLIGMSAAAEYNTDPGAGVGGAFRLLAEFGYIERRVAERAYAQLGLDATLSLEESAFQAEFGARLGLGSELSFSPDAAQWFSLGFIGNIVF